MSLGENNTNEQQNVDPAMESLLNFIPKDNSAEGSSGAEGSEGDEGASSAQDAASDTNQADETNDKGTVADEGSTFDFNKFLEGSSEGLFKSEEDFKAGISKLKEFDTLAQKVQVLESEKETIFANDYVKKLNNLIKQGYSQEQIDSFQNLSRMDVDKLDPKEALIQNEVLNNGRTRVLAEKIVSNKYGLSDLSIDDDSLTDEEIQERKDKLEIISAQMEDDAKPIIKGFKEELEGLSNIESPEQKALDEVAKRKAYEKALEPFVASLQENFPKKISLPTGEEGVEFTYDLPEDFISSISEEAKEYFNHPSLEVNKETVQEFLNIKKAMFVYSKLEDICNSFKEQGKAQGIKETIAKYENPHGLENSNVDVNVTNDNIEEQLYAIARK